MGIYAILKIRHFNFYILLLIDSNKYNVLAFDRMRCKRDDNRSSDRRRQNRAGAPGNGKSDSLYFGNGLEKPTFQLRLIDIYNHRMYKVYEPSEICNFLPKDVIYV